MSTYADPPEDHETRPLGRNITRVIVVIVVILIVGGSIGLSLYLVDLAEDPETRERIEQREQEEAQQDGEELDLDIE